MSEHPNIDKAAPGDDPPLRSLPLAGSTKTSWRERIVGLTTVIICAAMLATLVIAWRMMDG